MCHDRHVKRRPSDCSDFDNRRWKESGRRGGLKSAVRRREEREEDARRIARLARILSGAS